MCVLYFQGMQVHVRKLNIQSLSVSRAILMELKEVLLFFLFDLILYIHSTIFQLNRDGSSWVEQVLS